MLDDDDLPDHDYASIYGPDALAARHRARHAAEMAQLAAITTRLDAGNTWLTQFLAELQAMRDRRKSD